MSNPRIVAATLVLAVLLTMGGISVFAQKSTPNAHSKNVLKVQKIMGKNKMKAKGEDTTAFGTAGVGAGVGSKVKATDSDKFKKENKEAKNKLYKDSPEVKK